MNISDGELMQGVLAAAGFDLAASVEDADVILVNTCAIREHAEQRVLGRVAELNRLKRRRPDLVLGVTGCMAQRMGEELLRRAPYVDLVVGPDGYRRLPQALEAVRPGLVDPAGVARLGRVPADGVSAESSDGAANVSKNGGAARRPSLPVLPLGSGTATVPAGAGGAATSAAVRTRLAVLDFEPHEDYEGLEVHRAAGVSAWVPVQRGCNHRCTFCIVPYVRGPEKNRHPDRILDEVRQLAASGVVEIVLLGQTVNSYRHGDWSFARLLREVARVDGVRRVRFTSPHPNDVTPDLVEVMATEPTVCKQIHLPVQSGHNRTLKRMLRRYTVESFLEKVEMLRGAMPDIALSTDVIVGFPGETEAEFEATLDLMRTVRFDDAFMYRYSPREGTPATRLPASDFVEPAVAQARLERLIDLQRIIQAEINEAEVGRTVEVLVERAARTEGDMLGRTDSNKVVAFPGSPELIGRFVKVRLTRTTGATFVGEQVDRPGLHRHVA